MLDFVPLTDKQFVAYFEITIGTLDLLNVLTPEETVEVNMSTIDGRERDFTEEQKRKYYDLERRQALKRITEFEEAEAEAVPSVEEAISIAEKANDGEDETRMIPQLTERLSTLFSLMYSHWMIYEPAVEWMIRKKKAQVGDRIPRDFAEIFAMTTGREDEEELRKAEWPLKVHLEQVWEVRNDEYGEMILFDLGTKPIEALGLCFPSRKWFVDESSTGPWVKTKDFPDSINLLPYEVRTKVTVVSGQKCAEFTFDENKNLKVWDGSVAELPKRKTMRHLRIAEVGVIAKFVGKIAMGGNPEKIRWRPVLAEDLDVALDQRRFKRFFLWFISIALTGRIAGCTENSERTGFFPHLKEDGVRLTKKSRVSLADLEYSLGRTRFFTDDKTKISFKAARNSRFLVGTLKATDEKKYWSVEWVDEEPTRGVRVPQELRALKIGY